MGTAADRLAVDVLGCMGVAAGRLANAAEQRLGTAAGRLAAAAVLRRAIPRLVFEIAEATNRLLIVSCARKAAPDAACRASPAAG